MDHLAQAKQDVQRGDPDEALYALYAGANALIDIAEQLRDLNSWARIALL